VWEVSLCHRPVLLLIIVDMVVSYAMCVCMVAGSKRAWWQAEKCADIQEVSRCTMHPRATSEVKSQPSIYTSMVDEHVASINDAVRDDLYCC
jgi:hypothetical protein